MQSARALASQAVQSEVDGEHNNALNSYIEASKLYLDILRTNKDLPQDEKDQIKRLASRLLQRAERLKSAEPNLTSDTSGMLERNNEKVCFASTSLEPLPNPKLSELQIKFGAEYRRCTFPIYDSTIPVRGGDICQGECTDCSFVASLECAAEYDALWGTQLAHGALYPRNVHGPCASSSGVFQVRFHLNGDICEVNIDDSLPMNSNDELLCASIKHNCKQQWPALLEKAFLCVQRSSYAFTGSTATSDLYTLTGWIPEQILTHDDKFQRERTWNRLFHAWKNGQCLLSAGTGADAEVMASKNLQSLTTLHCYAITALSVDTDQRLVTLINPWKTIKTPSDDPQTSSRIPAKEVLIYNWEEFCAVFDTLGVNWNPKSYKQPKTLHGSWNHSYNEGVRTDHASTAQCDRYELFVAACDQDVLVHLERNQDVQEPEQAHYIALHAFDNQDRLKRMHVDHGGEMGVYVDERHTLLRLPSRSSAGYYTLVASRHGDDRRPFPAYTIKVWSDADVRLTRLSDTQIHRSTLYGAWQGRGGHERSGGFRHNPQFLVTIPVTSNALEMVLFRVTAQMNVPMRIFLLRGKDRVISADDHIVIAKSQAYQRGLSICAIPTIQPGQYVAVVSSFHPTDAEFALTIESSCSLSVIPLPAEGVGLSASHDELLEIACIITDGNLDPIDEGVSYVIKSERPKLENMNEWCVKTHKETGLWEECLAPDAPKLEWVRDAVMTYIIQCIPEQGTACLAGSTVHADKQFLEKFMPEIIDHLHYRIVDVSSIKELVRRWYGPEQAWPGREDRTRHRALDDIKGSIEGMHYADCRA
ncbi:cysteine protease [Malassezia yamatoensis]|uniref:Cysteine protease n=1 Tax=Malassezia yamatoensis TaxID=253288 RepID=A0AAJ6CHG3_9BASI|nr:cysteine protease [Malassezia yamatoensis]